MNEGNKMNYKKLKKEKFKRSKGSFNFLYGTRNYLVG